MKYLPRRSEILLLVACFLLVAWGSVAFARPSLGRVWKVQEGVWKGTWTMRSDGRTLDAEWVSPSGEKARDVLTIESVTDAKVIIYRKGVNGRYHGQLSRDHKQVVTGTGTWFRSGDTWSAVITDVTSAEPKLGRVWKVREGIWNGTWTMRSDGRTLDAEWVSPSGEKARDVLTLESVTGEKVVIFRKGVNGRYTGWLSRDGKQIVNGTGSWFRPGDTWSAVIK